MKRKGGAVTDKQLAKARQYKANRPWLSHLSAARQRCNDPKVDSYSYYGARGIKCLLTMPQIAWLWERDFAEKLNRPSLDRKFPDGNYTIENCRFIELSENAARASRKYWGCLNCGPEARHRTGGLCVHCFNTKKRKWKPENQEQKKQRRIRWRAWYEKNKTH